MGILKKLFSVDHIGRVRQNTNRRFGHCYRTFRIEELEDRRLLTVCGAEPLLECLTDSAVMAGSLSESEQTVPVVLAESNVQNWFDDSADTSLFVPTEYVSTANSALFTAEQLANPVADAVPVTPKALIIDPTNLIVTVLDDSTDATDNVISLREAIAYAEANIAWTAKEKTDFTEGQFGYSFKTNEIVAFTAMADDETYYIPTGWTGTESSIRNAMITFDADLTGNTITLLSDMSISESVVIDGTLGDGTGVILDRGLVTYNKAFFDTEGNFERFIAETLKGQTNSVFTEIWTDNRTDQSVYGKVLNITANKVPVTLYHLTITGGMVNPTIEGRNNGAGIENQSYLTLVDTSLVGNVSFNFHGGAIYNNGGTIQMIGGSLEGNYTARNGTIYSIGTNDINKSLSFDSITVAHNYASTSSFLESYEHGITVIVKDSVMKENNGNVIHMEPEPATIQAHFIISGTSFLDNYRNKKSSSYGIQIGNSPAEFTDCIFDHSK